MEPVPLAARVVEVIADCGELAHPRYRYGSGCIVVGRTVLTAAHVVADAQTAQVRDPNKVLHPATVDQRFVGDGDGPGPDLALVAIDSSTVDMAAIPLGMVDRDSADAEPVERCHVVGYPWFAERPSPDAIRDTADAYGHVPVLSKLASGLLSLHVSGPPRPLPPESASLGESEWSGMSGAPLVAAGCLLGVVTEHAAREGPSAITITPLTALGPDPAHPGWGPGVTDPTSWWERLGVPGLAALKRLPRRRVRPEPAYRATVREIQTRTRELRGRKREMSEIRAFATSSQGYRWLAGDAWTGKTALLAAAIAALPDEVHVIAYFLSRVEADANSNRFLGAVIPQLADLLDEDPPVADRHQFRALWERACSAVAAAEHHLLLVVDGLDEDLYPRGSPSVAALLPTVAGGRAHVLVSSRPYPELPYDVPVGHPLLSTAQTELEPFEGAAKLAALARQEIDELKRRQDDLATEVLAVLTAAAGPLAIEDLAILTTDVRPVTPAHTRGVRGLVTEDAARTLKLVGPATDRRYRFAHPSLLEYAQTDEDLCHPDYGHRIRRWAEDWRSARWPARTEAGIGTPRYLLGEYAQTLRDDPRQMADLTGDVGWVSTAVATVGVDIVLAELQTTAGVAPTHSRVAAMQAAVRGQAHHLRDIEALGDPAFVPRQLCLQATELDEESLAAEFRDRLVASPEPAPVPLWTTRRTSRALVLELGGHDDLVTVVAVVADGRVVSGGSDGRLLIWRTTRVDLGRQWPSELGCHDGPVTAVAGLADGRVVSGGSDGQLLVWDPAVPQSGPIELGRRHQLVTAVAGLADGRVVSGGSDGQLLVWDPAVPQSGPIELGRRHQLVTAVAGLADGRVVSGGSDGQLLVWDPAVPQSGPIELGRRHQLVTAVAGLADGRVVSGGSDGQLLVWDPAAPQSGPIELGRHDRPVTAVAALEDGWVVSGGSDGQLLVWDPAAPQSGPIKLGRHDRPVTAVAALEDGWVVSGGSDGRVLMWDPATPRPVPVGQHDSPITAVAWLADGRMVTGGGDGRVLVWDPSSPLTVPVELGRHTDAVIAVAGLADGRVISGGSDERVLVWDPATPAAEPVQLLRLHGPRLIAVVGLANGRVVCGKDSGVEVWDPAALQTRPIAYGHKSDPVGTVAGLADGRVVIGLSDGSGRVQVWDPAAPHSWPITLGRHDSGLVTALAGLADGRVVGGRRDGRLLLWDPVEPQTGPDELGRHDGAVTAVAGLADGRVISAGIDGHVWVWDAQARRACGLLACSASTFATTVPPSGTGLLVIAHQAGGLSICSI